MSEELSLRRQFSPMVALLRDSRISTEAKIELGTKWINAVQRNYQMGDIIICFAEHRDGLFQIPLAQILEASLDAPLYIFSSLQMQKHSSVAWISQAILWIGWIGIIAGFFLLQARIALLPSDWIQTTLLLLSVAFEFWLIWVWDNIFS